MADMIVLHHIASDSSPQVFEVPGGELQRLPTPRAATAHEIRTLIEQLLSQLPPDDQRAFKVSIRTEEMI